MLFSQVAVSIVMTRGLNCTDVTKGVGQIAAN